MLAGKRVITGGRLVCFLASDDAAFITGAAITIDGGALAWHGVRR